MLSHAAREVLAQIEQRGASFFADLVRATGRLASEVEDGLWELVAAGLATDDGFENLRSLVDPKRRRGEGRAGWRVAACRGAMGARRHQANATTNDARALAFADQLLARWGVLFRDLLAQGKPGATVARSAAGATPQGSTRRNSGRPLRFWIQRRAVCASRSARLVASHPALSIRN